jgi:hypothetical protein
MLQCGRCGQRFTPYSPMVRGLPCRFGYLRRASTDQAPAFATIAKASVALTGSAGAQQSSPDKNLTYEQVKLIAETAYETCVAQGLHVSVHVVGREGETRFAIRGDGSGPTTFENSRRKAYAVRTRPDFAIEGGLPIKVGAEIHWRRRS